MTDLRLIQFVDREGVRRVGRVADAAIIEEIAETPSVHALAQVAIDRGGSLADAAEAAGVGPRHDYDAIVEERRLLAPIDHPDPAHLLVTGTGLTHLGSADARDQMHTRVLEADEDTLTDSMRMFRMGLEGGKPADGTPGVQPEWFYKGDGSTLVAPEHPIEMPGFALDGGEEPEVAGIYLIDGGGDPRRVGWALGNEFSDHVMERQNYLYLAHSKLRSSAIGPELNVGDIGADVVGTVAVRRDGDVIWQSEWRSGESNMSHALAGLEHHHFKYEAFRRPGDVHVHYFGTAVLSFAAGVETQDGDVFEISASGFGRPLRNQLRHTNDDPHVQVRPL